MKKLLFLGACLVALASQPVMAQTGTASVTVVHFTRVGSGLAALIAYEGGKTEQQTIKGSSMEETVFCQQVVTKLYQQGYTLRSTLGLAGTWNSTLVFVKER